MIYNLLSAEYLADTFEPIALYLTLGFISAILLTIAVCFFLHKESLKQVSKSLFVAFVFYALIMGIFLVVITIIKKYNLAYLEDNYVNKEIISLVFIPLLVTLVIGLIGGLIHYLLLKKSDRTRKIYSLSFFCTMGLLVIATLILIAVYFSRNILGDGYYTSEDSKFNSLLLYVLSAGLVLVCVATALIVGRNNKTKFNSRTLTFAGVCLALSFTLSFIKFEAAWLQGGSITLASFLPICLFAYVYGMKKGLLVGFIYGLLQAIQDPFIIHPAQFLLDYPIAFSMITFSGLLTDLNVLNSFARLKFVLSTLLTGIFRFVAHTISGVFAFGAYALDSGATNFLTYSAIYNSYVFVDIAIVMIVGVILLSSKGVKNELNKLKSSFAE